MMTEPISRELDDELLQALNEPRRMFYARGQTYELREQFSAWGWRWNQRDRAWVYDASIEITFDSPEIRRFAKPGIEISWEEVPGGI